ncbi:DUF6896 domain-containing protein [Aeromonas hydrophila]|uniref:DUF6896 domain-containing protein n=1 Tax=Aeromonas hydrophila TaxID=644 RepID=UPI003EC8890E
MDNLEKIKNLIPLWYAQRKWAEELLVRVFHLASAEKILEPEHRGTMTIPGTHWVYRTHGVGVDIYRTASVGGIDFDFNNPDPDEWRLRIFFENSTMTAISLSPRTASCMRMKNCLTAL